MRHRKIREQSGVLVPTSGEHYCDSSGENGCQAAPWCTGPQLSISTDPSHLHQCWIMLQLLLSSPESKPNPNPTDLYLHVHPVSGCSNWWWGPNAGLVQILSSMAEPFWSGRSVFVLDEQEPDPLPGSLSRFLAPKHVWCIHNAGGGAFLNFT